MKNFEEEFMRQFKKQQPDPADNHDPFWEVKFLEEEIVQLKQTIASARETMELIIIQSGTSSSGGTLARKWLSGHKEG